MELFTKLACLITMITGISDLLLVTKSKTAGLKKVEGKVYFRFLVVRIKTNRGCPGHYSEFSRTSVVLLATHAPLVS